MRQPRPIAGRLDHLGDVAAGHWPATLGAKDKGRLRLLLSPQFAQGSQLVALDRVNGVDAVLEPPDVQVPFGEIDLIPFEIDSLGHPQAVSSHDQEQRGVTLPIAALTGGFDELVELALAQVFRSIGAVHGCPRSPTFRKSPFGGLTRALLFPRHCRDQAHAWGWTAPNVEIAPEGISESAHGHLTLDLTARL